MGLDMESRLDDDAVEDVLDAVDELEETMIEMTSGMVRWFGHRLSRLEKLIAEETKDESEKDPNGT